MSEAPILLDMNAETGVSTLVFNRPDVLNAIDVPLAEQLLEAVGTIASTPSQRCILLKGAGRAFCAGGDVAAFSDDPANSQKTAHDLLNIYHPTLIKLYDVGLPIVLAAHGVCAGAGFSLAGAADLVVATHDTRFVMAYEQIGATPDGSGTFHLARKLPRAKLNEMMLLGLPLTAEEAHGLGLVNFLVEDRKALDEKAMAVAKKVAQGPTRAFVSYRKLMDATHGNCHSDQLHLEQDSFETMAATSDFQNAVTAFANKQKPNFQGK